MTQLFGLTYNLFRIEEMIVRVWPKEQGVEENLITYSPVICTRAYDEQCEGKKMLAKDIRRLPNHRVEVMKEGYVSSFKLYPKFYNKEWRNAISFDTYRSAIHDKPWWDFDEVDPSNPSTKNFPKSANGFLCSYLNESTRSAIMKYQYSFKLAMKGQRRGATYIK